MPEQRGAAAPPRSSALSGRRIEHRVDIMAPAEHIWELLCDIGSWKDWNPLYIAASGSLSVGESIALTADLPGMKPQHVTATVIAMDPNMLLQFRGIMMGGLIRGTRYIEIVETEPGRCTVFNGEAIAGLLGPIIARAVGSQIHQGLERMSAAFKQAAEARVEQACAISLIEGHPGSHSRSP